MQHTVLTLPTVSLLSNINDSNPVKMLLRLHKGFQAEHKRKSGNSKKVLSFTVMSAR